MLSASHPVEVTSDLPPRYRSCQDGRLGRMLKTNKRASSEATEKLDDIEEGMQQQQEQKRQSAKKKRWKADISSP